jgi:hypothetical protein
VAKIHFTYQSVIKCAEAVAEAAVNLSAFAVLVIGSLLRLRGGPAIQTNPFRALIGKQDFLLPN